MEPISKHEQRVRPGEPLERKHPPARLSTEQGEPRARSGKELSRRKVPFLAVVAVALSVLALGACGGTERGDASAADSKAGQESGVQGSAPTASTTASVGSEDDGRDKAGARAGEAVARDDAARAGDAEAGTGGDGARAGEARAGAGDAGARAGEATASTDDAEIAGNSRGDDGGTPGGKRVPERSRWR